MKTFDTNEWMVLNNLIYNIHTVEKFDEMRKNLLEQLKLLINFDSGDFFLAKPGKRKLIQPVMVNCEVDLSEEYQKLDAEKKILDSGNTRSCRC